MQEHKFDDILNYLCSGIMSKTERQSVRDELYDHLMCRYETNIAVGMDETEAEKNAVDALGDKSMLKFKLSQVHSYAPKPTMKKAMNLLILGYILISFHISFFAEMKEITTFIGNICLLVALFCLGKANKKIKWSFTAKAVSFLVSVFCKSAEPIYNLPIPVTASTGVVSMVLSFLCLVFLILGLKELVKPYLDGYPKKIPFDSGAAVNLLWGAVNTFIFTGFALDGKTSAEFESITLLCFGMAVIIFNLLIFVRSSKLLWNSDHEYKIEDSSAKKWIAAVLALIIGVVPTVAVDFALAGQKAETSVYSVDDTDIPQAEYERICSNLLSYGIPEKIVYSLPESEILKYSDSINKNDYDEETLKYLGDPCYSHEAEICNDVNAVFSVCAVGMADSRGYPYVRIISWVEYLSTGKGYDDALFWGYLQKNLILYNSYEAYEGDLLLILSEENGKIIKNEPLDIYTDKNGLTDRMTGVRFESKEKMTLIHAETFGLSSNKGVTYANYYLQLAHRVSPFTLFYRSPLTVKENNVRQNGMGYTLYNENTMISWCSPESAEE